MPRRPSIPSDLIRQVMLGDGVTRPTAREAAEILAKMTGTRLSPEAIRGHIHRHGKAWNLPPANAGAAQKTMDYRIEAILDVPYAHRQSWPWYACTAYERVQAGKLDASSTLGVNATSYVEALLEHGDVVDHDAEGLYVRPAWPWEVGDYLPAPAPDAVRWLLEALQGSTGIYRGVLVTEEHRAAWTARLAEEEMG